MQRALLLSMKTSRTNWIHHILLMTRVISIMTLLARSRGTTAISRQFKSSHSLLNIRGGASSEPESNSMAFNDNEKKFSTVSSSKETQFVTLASPAPGSPFHLALPVHDLNIAKDFYGRVLGCIEGRSSSKWQDYSLNGHQIVCHWVGNDYRCQDYFNPVDGDEVPVPHYGLVLSEQEFHQLATRVREAGIPFIIEPHLRFQGMPGEQWTMFFKDPSGNNLEFKAMTTVDNLFAKYNVA